MSIQKTKDYGLPYRELVYTIWYNNGRPNMTELASKVPVDAVGDTPMAATLSKWRKDYDWDARADNTDVQVVEQTDRELVKIRLDMMKRHAEQARKIADAAFTFLTEITEENGGGFDSSASAVNAWSKAVEEEKKSTGMQIALTNIFSLSDDDLKKKMDQYLGKLSNVGAVLVAQEDYEDGEVVEDALSTEETDNESGT